MLKFSVSAFRSPKSRQHQKNTQYFWEHSSTEYSFLFLNVCPLSFTTVLVPLMSLFLTINYLSTTASSRRESCSVWCIHAAGGLVPWTGIHTEELCPPLSKLSIQIPREALKMPPVLIPKGKANSCNIFLPGYKVRRKIEGKRSFVVHP